MGDRSVTPPSPSLLRRSSPGASAGTSERLYRAGAEGPCPGRRGRGEVHPRLPPPGTCGPRDPRLYLRRPSPAAPLSTCGPPVPPSTCGPRPRCSAVPRSPPAVPTGPARRRRTRATPSCLGPAGGMASLRDVTCARRANRERRAVMSSQRGGGGAKAEPRLFPRGAGRALGVSVSAACPCP